MAEKALMVINPNSSVHLTEGIDRAVDPLRALGVALGLPVIEPCQASCAMAIGQIALRARNHGERHEAFG